MIYQNVFNCDELNFNMYIRKVQNGLYVLPDKNLKPNLIITLLERNNKTSIYSGRYLNYMIIDVSSDHENEMLANLWYLTCKMIDKGFSDLLNGKLKGVLRDRNIINNEVEKCTHVKWPKDQSIKKPTSSKSDNKIKYYTTNKKKQ